MMDDAQLNRPTSLGKASHDPKPKRSDDSVSVTIKSTTAGIWSKLRHSRVDEITVTLLDRLLISARWRAYSEIFRDGSTRIARSNPHFSAIRPHTPVPAPTSTTTPPAD